MPDHLPALVAWLHDGLAASVLERVEAYMPEQDIATKKFPIFTKYYVDINVIYLYNGCTSR